MTDCEVATQSGRETLPETISEQIESIPLYLIPRAIADQIREKRETIASIEVRQGAGHFFTITVKTSERRGLRSRCAQEQVDEKRGETGE
jgi:hypothetical protein